MSDRLPNIVVVVEKKVYQESSLNDALYSTDTTSGYRSNVNDDHISDIGTMDNCLGQADFSPIVCLPKESSFFSFSFLHLFIAQQK